MDKVIIECTVKEAKYLLQWIKIMSPGQFDASGKPTSGLITKALYETLHKEGLV